MDSQGRGGPQALPARSLACFPVSGFQGSRSGFSALVSAFRPKREEILYLVDSLLSRDFLKFLEVVLSALRQSICRKPLDRRCVPLLEKRNPVIIPTRPCERKIQFSKIRKLFRGLRTLPAQPNAMLLHFEIQPTELFRAAVLDRLGPLFGTPPATARRRTRLGPVLRPLPA